MRASLRLFLLTAVVVLPAGATANAAPLLTNAVLSYSDDIGPLGPFTVDVTAGQSPEFCGSAGSVACNGTDLTNEAILLEDDFIDFTGTSILFNLEGGGGALPGNPTYRDLNLPGATFTIALMTFSEGGALVGVTPVLTNVIGVNAGTEVTFTANSITFTAGTLGILDGARGQIRLDLAIRAGTPPPPQPPVPEPASLLLLGSGLAAAALVRQRRSSR